MSSSPTPSPQVDAAADEATRVMAYRLGLLGLIPFFAAPFWLTVSPGTVPQSLDYLWLNYAALIASFMAGTFWGMALVAARSAARTAAMLLSNGLMLATWVAMQLDFGASMAALAAIFALLFFAELWRERAVAPLPGYMRLRLLLTLGVLASLGWRGALTGLLSS